MTFEQRIQRYPKATFSRGQTFLLKNETPSEVRIIERGVVIAYTITPDGAERQACVHFTGEDVPLGLAAGLTTVSEYFYRAFTDCDVRIVPVLDYARMLRYDNATLYKRYVRGQSQLQTAIARISALEHPKASDKVAFMLQNMASQFGTRLRPYQDRLRLAITQQEMADALGLTRETTGIELKKLEVKNIISHSRKSYVLYMEKLRQYLDGR